MIVEKIILEELQNIKTVNEQLLDSLTKTPMLITQKETDKLRTHIEKQEQLSNLQMKHILEMKTILGSTHHKSLSDIIHNTSSEHLKKEFQEFKDTLYKIVITNNLNRELLEDCQRINNTHLNLIIGRKQEPTNYNFTNQNINAHLLAKFKNNNK